jgi:hypothetical protein
VTPGEALTLTVADEPLLPGIFSWTTLGDGHSDAGIAKGDRLYVRLAHKVTGRLGLPQGAVAAAVGILCPSLTTIHLTELQAGASSETLGSSSPARV